MPGTIPAVHYNEGGEGVGYHDLTSVNTGGKYRTDNVDIRDCEEGGQNIGWNQIGEWYQYNVNVQAAGPYHLGLRYATTYTACKLRVYCDGTDVSGIVSLPATGGWTSWRTVVLKNLSLPAGNHTIRLETVEGEFDFSTLKFETGTTAIASGSDNFDSGSFSGLWNYNNNKWVITAGQAIVTSSTDTGFYKRAMGNVGWTDYTVEADVKIPPAGNGGLIFRVRNPANSQSGDANNSLSSNFLQGYYAGVETGGIVLGKHNYNWTTLAYKTQALTANLWYKLRALLNGDNIKIYLNDMITPVINYTDTTPIISGKAGIRSHNAAMAFDNFLITASTGALFVGK